MTQNTVAQPTNDDCASATLITQTATCVTTTIDAALATASPELTTLCPFLPTPDDDVWVSFVATTANPTVEVTGSASYDPVIQLWDSCGGIELYCSDATLGGGTEAIYTTGLTIGNTYVLRVFDYYVGAPLTTTFDVCVYDAPPPIGNDECANAIVLTQNATCINTTGDVAGATQSLAGCLGTADDDVWFTFQATSANVTIDVLGSANFDAVVELLDSCGGASIACEDATIGGSSLESLTAYGLTIGQNYAIRVYDWYTGPPPSTTFDICVYTAPPPPANDSCFNAYLLGCDTTVSGSTASMTFDNVGTCGTDNTGPGAWYAHLGTGDDVTISTCDQAAYDTKLSVFSGTCGALVCVGGNDDGTNCLGFTSEMTFPTTPGTMYYILVHGYLQATGTFDLTLTCTFACNPVPSNDDCASAASLTVGTAGCVPTNSTNVCAAGAPFTPTCDPFGVINDVWYTFNTGTNVNVNITLALGTATDVHYALYDACGGIEVECNSFTSVGTNTMSGLNTTTDYYLQLWNGSGEEGTFDVCLEAGPPPPSNDECATPILLFQNATCVTTQGDVAGATESLPGCTGNADDDVWFEFTAITPNPYVQVTGSAQFDAVVEVYDGCLGFSLACVDNSFVGGGTELANLTGLTPGNNYQIRVYDWFTGYPGTTTFDICVYDAPAPPANDSCVNAIQLTQGTTCVNTQGDVTGATESLTGCTGTADDDVWYYFVAGSTDPVVEVLGSAGFDPVVEVLSACGGTSLFCTDATFAGQTELTPTTGLTVGNVYYVRVYDWYVGIPSTTTFDICVYDNPPPPANDDCAGAISLTVQVDSCSSTTTATNFNATDSGTPTPTCATYVDGDVWFQLVVPASGRVSAEISEANGFFDTGMEAYTGNCGALTSIVCDDDGGFGLFSRVNLVGQLPGDTIYLRVWPYGGGTIINFNICAWEPPPPANDSCGGAIVLFLDQTCNYVAGSVDAATESLVGCTGTADNDVWYQFTAITANATVDVLGSAGFDPVLEVFDGCGGTSLGCIDLTLAGAVESFSSTTLTPGSPYFIRVYDWYTGEPPTTDFQICVYDNTLPNCEVPANVHNSHLTQTSVRFNWDPVVGAHHYRIRGQLMGNTNWVTLYQSSSLNTFRDITGLVDGNTYIWKVRAWCDAHQTYGSAWSTPDTFTTGCQYPDSMWAAPINSIGAQLHWTPVAQSSGYEIRGRATGGATWTHLLVGNLNTNRYVLGLASSTTYEWQMRSFCDTDTSGWSPLQMFTTTAGFNKLGSQAGFGTPEEELSMSIFPNPTAGQALLRLSRPIDFTEVELSLFDMSGKRTTGFATADISGQEIQLDLKQLPDGVYQVIVSGAEVIARERLVIQH